MTHETAFDREDLPASSVILGGGAVGVEFAQAYGRLGVEVTLVEMEERILPREDPDLTGRLRDILEEEGVEVLTGTRAVAAGRDGRLRTVTVEPTAGDAGVSGRGPAEAPEGRGAGAPGEDRRRTLRAEEIFVATGRRPNVEDLGLEEAGVDVSPEGIVVDDRLRTSRKGVYAAGDVIGGHLFTHVADHEARTVIRNALFPFASRVDYSVIPWAVYTEPTLARIGPTEDEARRRHGDGISVHAYDLADLDRAVTDREARGLVKLVADRRGRLLAGHVLSPGAGSLVVEVALAVREGLKVTDLADLVHPYPTLSEGVRRAANQAYRDRLTPTTRRLLDGWHRLARALGL
jgi:pyruvate/2-oxoglutarate dehydrogenase complex dihydrolipoamide dehydrogenase (E3) component